MGLRLTRLRVTLHMRSGGKLRFTAGTITKRYEGNALTGLEAKDSSGWPFYVRLDDIEAITSRRVISIGWAQ